MPELSPSTSAQGPAKVLVVDDDHKVRNLLEEVIDRMDLKPIVFARAGDAFDHIRDNEVDVMLLDIQMPVVGGLELLNTLKRHNMEIPTVIISAFVSPEILQKLKDLNIKRILTKPFRIDRLMQEIRDTLDNRSTVEDLSTVP